MSNADARHLDHALAGERASEQLQVVYRWRARQRATPDTEANDEKRAAAGGINQPGMIFPAFLNDATGKLAADINPDAPGFAYAIKKGFVHIHRGIAGSAPGGASALENTSYRWLIPVAVLTI